MATRAEHFDLSVQKLQHGTLPEDMVLGWSLDPLLVILVGIDRDVSKGLAPVLEGRVIVGVRDHDGLEASQLLHLVNGLLVDVGDAVPEDVARGGANQDGSLTDGVRGRSGDRDHVLGIGLGGGEDVLVLARGLEGLEGGPLLAAPADILARLVADDAGGEGLVRFGGGSVGAAGDADKG